MAESLEVRLRVPRLAQYSPDSLLRIVYEVMQKRLMDFYSSFPRNSIMGKILV